MSYLIPVLESLVEALPEMAEEIMQGNGYVGAVARATKRYAENELRTPENKKMRVGDSPTVWGSAPRTVWGSAPRFRLITGSAPESSSENMSADNSVRVFQDYLKVHNKPPAKTAGNPFFFSCMHSNVFSSPEGYQAVNQMQAIGTTSQWLIDTPAPNAVQSGIAWYKLNPTDFTSQTSLIPAATQNRDQRIMLEYVTCTIDLVNFSNCAAWIVLDINAAKTDNSAYSAYYWNVETINEANGVTQAVAHAATTLTTVAANHGAAGIEWPGNKYSYYKDCHKVWKPLKSYEMNLAAGQTVRIKLGIEVNSLQSTGEIGNASTYPKDCLDFNLTQYGTPVKSNIAAGTCTYAITKIGMVSRYRCKFRNLEHDMVNKTKMSYVSYNTVANNAIATESKMDIDTDAQVVNKVVS